MRALGIGLLQMAPSPPLEFVDPLARLESMDADELRETLASLLSVAKAR